MQHRLNMTITQNSGFSGLGQHGPPQYSKNSTMGTGSITHSINTAGTGVRPSKQLAQQQQNPGGNSSMAHQQITNSQNAWRAYDMNMTGGKQSGTNTQQPNS